MVQSSEIVQSDKKTLPKPALRGDAPGCEPADDIVVERQGGRVTAKWNITYFAQHNKSFKVLYSKYFVVEGYDCRLLVYPAGMNMKHGSKLVSAFRFISLNFYMAI